MPLIILFGAIIIIPSPFLPTPRYKPHRPLGPKPILHHQPHSLKHRKEPPPIIIGPGLRARIPRINMPSHQQNLSGFVVPNNLKHQITRTAVILQLRLKQQIHSDLLFAVLHALQHLAVLDGDRGDWDFRGGIVVVHVPGVH
jgi:hypothetical protein